MNALKNKVQLIGNLGNNPEIIYLESGKKLAKFSLATNETYKNAKGENVASGVYFYRIDAGPFSETRKMVILK